MAHQTGVYLIYNKQTGMAYIGMSARDIRERWGVHRKLLKRGKHPNRRMQIDYNRGRMELTFTILEEIVGTTAEILLREDAHIEAWAAIARLYNVYHRGKRGIW